jgi:hypothetical protein
VTVKRDKVEYKALGSIPTPKKKKRDKVVDTCNPSTWEAEVGGL